MRRINRVNVRIEILALLALVCYKQSDEAAALEHLQAALGLAEPGGWVRNFVDLGDPMRDLLERLNQARPGQTFAKQVLDACRAEARSGPSSRLSGQASVAILTQREIELLPLIAEGLSNKEIAAKLHIAPVTVKKHLQNIYGKLNAKGRIKALSKAHELGLLTRD
jgi:LuxR family maltose regulon positive regulatory protein